jgi:hypothetical protein
VEVSDTQAIVGILISLMIFCLLLWHAVLVQKLAPSGSSTLESIDGLFARLFRLPRRPGEEVERIVGFSSSNSAIRVLGITRDRGCQERLRGLAEFYGWDFFLCSNCESAAVVFATENVPIVLCDRDTLDINWREAFEVVVGADRSRCVILCSKADDNTLWQEVVRCGGYDVVRKPIREEQLVRTIQFAWNFWNALHPRSSMNKMF